MKAKEKSRLIYLRKKIREKKEKEGKRRYEGEKKKKK